MKTAADPQLPRLRPRLHVGALAVGLALCGTPCPALDPDKALSQYSHAVWRERNGLPSDIVGAIRQTRDGYLWFGTLNGLARFDGVRFTSFDPLRADAPLLHRIQSLYEDEKGALWIGSRGGLTRLQGGRFESYAMPEDRRQSGIRTILVDPRGRIWARTLTDLFELRGGRLELVAPDVRSLGLRPDGVLSVTTHGGLGHVEDGRVVLERTAPPVRGVPRPFSLLAAVLQERDGTRWFGATWGLGRLLPDGRWTVFTAGDGLPTSAVTALCLDRDGTVWVGTTGGLARISHGRPAPAGRHHPLREARILALYEDRDGALWVGTDTDGVHQLSDALLTPLTRPEGLLDDLAGPVLGTRDGSIWIGTPRGLNRLRGGHIETLTSRDGLVDNGVYSLAEDPAGRLWIGGGQGPLQYLEDGRVRSYSAPGLPRSLRRVTAIQFSRDGALWVGTDLDGLYRVEHGTATRVPGAADRASSDHVARIHERPDGSVWIATDQGIRVWDRGHQTVYGTADGLPTGQVRAFHEAGESLWIGTYGGGLARFRGGRFETLPRTSGLPDTVIYEILEDADGQMFMSSNRGVIRVAREALERLADGAGSEGSPFVLYGVSDGLKSSACVGNVQPAGWRSADGRLWFPTRRGVVWLDPRHASAARTPASALLERVSIDGRPQPLEGPAVAAPGRGELSFDYTAPSFQDASALHFRYRLDGFDADWQEAGSRRTAHYTNVPPGRYTFRVGALTPGLVPGEEARLEIELEPHFYQTASFYGACLAAAMLVIWGLHLLRLRQVRGRFSLLLSERGRIAREMHDALDQGFTAISLQLDVCARVSASDPPEGALRQRLELAKNLLEYTRSEARRSISDLRSEALERGDLPTALAKLAEQFRSGPDLEIEVSIEGTARPLPGAVEDNLLRICQEAVTNAIRHGHAREVTIALAFAPGTVRLRVADTGCGFDPAAAASEREGHFGLMGMRERVKKLRGRLRLESAPGRGTAVQLEIPVPK